MTTIFTQPVMLPTPTDPLAAFGPLVARRTPDGFDDRPYERFSLTPSTPTIGAEIAGIRLSGELPEETLFELRRALLEWKVLFFREQRIERAEQRAFAARWGELERHPFFKYTQPGQTDVDVATLAKDASVGAVENLWHNDVTWHEFPSFASVLRAVEIPPVGGDTLWADMARPTTCCPPRFARASIRSKPSTTGSIRSAAR